MTASFAEVYQEITPLFCQDVEDLRRRDCAVLLVNTAQYKINCHNPKKELFRLDVTIARDLAQEETLAEISAMMEANGYLNYDSEYFVVKCSDNGVFITFEDEQLAKDIIAHSNNYKQSFLKASTYHSTTLDYPFYSAQNPTEVRSRAQSSRGSLQSGQSSGHVQQRLSRLSGAP